MPAFWAAETHRGTFLISDMTEGELTQQMAYSSALAFAAAAGMIIYALWAMAYPGGR